MEPRIQFAKTSDGVNIAFWTMGEGDVLIYMSQPLQTSMQTALQVPETRVWHECLARGRKLVRYDFRGSGLSQRDISDYSTDRMRLDLEAVVDQLGVDTVSIWAEHDSGPIAVAYVAGHPDRVKALVLWCSWARIGDIEGFADEKSDIEAMERMIETNLRLYIEVVAGTIGGMPPALARRFADASSKAASPKDLKRFMDQDWKFDVTALLPSIQCPTLVLHPRDQQMLRMENGARLAAGIPNAHFVLLDDDSAVPWLRDPERVAARLDEFLGEGEEATEGAKLATEHVHTILFTDVEGSTALTQRLGDVKARELLREHELIVREALKAHNGSEVKTMGDGFMASFSSATKALECAIAMQRSFAQHNESAKEPIRVRVGLNAGEPIAEDDDLFGTAVNLAARICSQAEAGQILAPIVVRELAAGKQFMFADLGETELRGFEDPVRLYELRWREAG